MIRETCDSLKALIPKDLMMHEKNLRQAVRGQGLWKNHCHCHRHALYFVTLVHLLCSEAKCD